MLPKFRKYGLVDTRSNERAMRGFNTKQELLEHYFTEFLLQRGHILKQQYDTFKKFMGGQLITNTDILPFKIVTYGSQSLSQDSWADIDHTEAMLIAGQFTTLTPSGENLKHKSPAFYGRDTRYNSEGYEADQQIRLNISAERAKGSTLLNKLNHRVNQVELRLLIEPKTINDIKVFNRLGLYQTGETVVKIYDDFIKQLLVEYPNKLEVINIISSPKDSINQQGDFYINLYGCSLSREHCEFTLPKMSRKEYAKKTSNNIRQAVSKLQSLGYSNRQAKKMLAK